MNKNFDIQKLKQIELEMLKQFISICDELQLQYFAIGGTLLGAVRHNGFIPWDDDIDIGMLRKDYDIFLQNAQKLLPKPYFLQTHNTDTEYSLNFAKIRNSNTTFIESSVANRNMNHGVYIDIFPLDYYPDDILSQIKFDVFWKILHFRMRSEFIIPKEYKASFPKKILQKILMWISKLIYPSAEKAILAEERLMKSVKLSTKIANLCGVLGKGEVMSVEYFNSTKKLMFENLNICVPGEYTKYLEHIYGDYMKQPPKEKQIAHHYTDTVDLENSYMKYIFSN